MDCFQMAVESSLQVVVERWVSQLPRGLQLIAGAHQLAPHSLKTPDLNEAIQHVAGMPAAAAVQVRSELPQGTGAGSYHMLTDLKQTGIALTHINRILAC